MEYLSEYLLTPLCNIVREYLEYIDINIFKSKVWNDGSNDMEWYGPSTSGNTGGRGTTVQFNPAYIMILVTRYLDDNIKEMMPFEKYHDVDICNLHYSMFIKDDSLEGIIDILNDNTKITTPENIKQYYIEMYRFDALDYYCDTLKNTRCTFIQYDEETILQVFQLDPVVAELSKVLRAAQKGNVRFEWI